MCIRDRLGSVFPLERSKLKLGKQAQKLQAQCKAIGYTEELAKPRPFELKNISSLPVTFGINL